MQKTIDKNLLSTKSILKLIESVNTLIKPLPGYEKEYGVSPDGKVYSFNYRGSIGKIKELHQSSLFDKRRKNTTMYKRTKIRSNVIAIHRLVAITFIPNPNKYPEVNHKDGIKHNNNVNNLEWCTTKQNNKHAVVNGLDLHCKGSDHGCAKKKKKIAIKIKQMINSGIACIDIANNLNVSKHIVYDIRRNKTWRHV